MRTKDIDLNAKGCMIILSAKAVVSRNTGFLSCLKSYRVHISRPEVL